MVVGGAKGILRKNSFCRMMWIKGVVQMSDFLQWEGWNAVSSICQIFIALFAFMAICITISQISGKANAKLGVFFKFGLGLEKSGAEVKVVPGISIHIANLGMAPIYISECGIEFFQGKTSKTGFFLTEEPFVLQSGENIVKSMSHLEMLLPEFDDKVSLHDKVRIYVKSGTGKTIYKKTDFDYASFKFEFEKFVKRADESNSKKVK